MAESLKPITVLINYNDRLKVITGVDSEKAVVSDGIFFTFFLGFIFSSYPEIQIQFPPGSLGMTINRRAPTDLSRLKDGDTVSLYGI